MWQSGGVASYQYLNKPGFKPVIYVRSIFIVRVIDLYLAFTITISQNL